MMNESEWARLRGLREREDSLTDGEREELDVLLRRADEEEAGLLTPALERMATEAGRLEAAAADVRAICEREERLARRMER